MIEYGVAILPIPGEVESGDGYLVKDGPDSVLVSVVDGLGHGPEAAAAMRLAIETLKASGQEDITVLMRRCHDRLRSTRGAVLSIASLDFSQRTMTWLGIGNIVGILIRPGPDDDYEQTFLVSRNGVVGQNLPALQTATMAIQGGDTLVFATDGVSEEFLEGIDHRTAVPDQLAQQIMGDYALNNDDALVLVVRYLGAASEP